MEWVSVGTMSVTVTSLLMSSTGSFSSQIVDESRGLFTVLAHLLSSMAYMYIGRAALLLAAHQGYMVPCGRRVCCSSGSLWLQRFVGMFCREA